MHIYLKQVFCAFTDSLHDNKPVLPELLQCEEQLHVGGALGKNKR